jgi:hypothetical protein
MKVRLKTIYAGPSGSAHPGEVIDVSEREGAELVNGGYADTVKQAQIETAVVHEAENTATATGKPQSKKKR